MHVWDTYKNLWLQRKPKTLKGPSMFQGWNKIFSRGGQGEERDVEEDQGSQEENAWMVISPLCFHSREVCRSDNWNILHVVWACVFLLEMNRAY